MLGEIIWQTGHVADTEEAKHAHQGIPAVEPGVLVRAGVIHEFPQETQQRRVRHPNAPSFTLICRPYQWQTCTGPQGSARRDLADDALLPVYVVVQAEVADADMDGLPAAINALADAATTIRLVDEEAVFTPGGYAARVPPCL